MFENLKNKNIVLYILIFIIAIFVTSLITNYDYDLFARLEVGEIFFKLHTVLKHDPFSYTPTLYWFDHEWGSGVIFYAFLKLFGPAGLVILNAILYFFTIFFILKHNKNLKYPLLISFAFLFILKEEAGHLIRCQAFTFMLTSMTLYILEKFRQNNSKLIWTLPAIIAIWGNLHGGVAAGLGIISIYALLYVIQRKENALKLLGITLLSYAALLINPYGIRYLAYMYYTITVPRTNIEDWVSIFHPKFLHLYICPLVIIFSMLFCKIYRNFQTKKFDIYEYVIVFIPLTLGIMHIKSFPLATIIIFFFSISDIDFYLNKLKYTKIINRSLYVVTIIMTLSLPFTIATPRLTAYRFPVAEVEFIKINNMKGNILAPFDEAGYVSYKLFPNNKIFIDGRYDGVYPMKIFNEYLRFENKYTNWTNAFNNYPTDIIITKNSLNSYEGLKEDVSLGWKEIFRGDRHSIFVKKENVKPFYKEPSYDINYYKKNLFKTDFIKYIKKEDYD